MWVQNGSRGLAAGRGKGVLLLCANCSCIDPARDWTLSVNIKRPPKRA